MKKLIKYVALMALGILLYMLSAECAFRDRGYSAVGGEIIFLLLPLFYYLIASMTKNNAKKGR